MPPQCPFHVQPFWVRIELYIVFVWNTENHVPKVTHQWMPKLTADTRIDNVNVTSLWWLEFNTWPQKTKVGIKYGASMGPCTNNWIHGGILFRLMTIGYKWQNKRKNFAQWGFVSFMKFMIILPISDINVRLVRPKTGAEVFFIATPYLHAIPQSPALRYSAQLCSNS